LASIGVLKVLERHFGRDNMPFDMIVGTSIGSLIGAAYCLGMSLCELEQKSTRFSWPTLVDFGLSPTGLLKGDKLEAIIKDIIPFALTATDIENGEELTCASGDLITLIRASCSWPGIFSAVEVGGRLLVDGGIRNSIPTKAANEMGATFVIAVNPGFAVKDQKISNVITSMIQSIQIMGEELNAYQAKIADVVIKPKLVNIDQFDYDQGPEIIRQGERVAEAKMGKLKRKLFFHW